MNQLQAGDAILIKNHTARSFEPKYKGTYRVVKIHGNNVEIRDFRGNISMVHITDVKKTTLTEQVAGDYEQLAKQGRFSKKCIPIRPVKQDEDPTETITIPGAPPEVEGPPSSHLTSKTKQQTTSTQQDSLECNPSTTDPLERNPAQIQPNELQIVPGIDIFVQWTCALLWAKSLKI